MAINQPVPLPMLIRILSIPLGPRVLFTRSPIAMAPTKEERRAVSALSSSALCFKIRIGLRETIIVSSYEQTLQTEMLINNRVTTSNNDGTLSVGLQFQPQTLLVTRERVTETLFETKILVESSGTIQTQSGN